MRSNKSIVVAKFLAFMYYSEYGFKDFFVGTTADPSNLYMGEDMVRITKNFEIAKIEKREVAIEVINYFLDLGCMGNAVHSEIEEGYVYVFLKIDWKVSGGRGIIS